MVQGRATAKGFYCRGFWLDWAHVTADNLTFRGDIFPSYLKSSGSMDTPASPSDKTALHRLGVGSDFPRHAEVRVLLSGALRFADAVVLVATAAFTYWMRNDQFEMPTPYLVAITLSVILQFSLGQVTGLYKFEALTRFPQQLGAASLCLSAVMACLAMVGYLTKTADIFSRLWLITWFFIAYACMVVVRVIVIRRLEAWRTQGGLRRRLAIVGAGEKGKRLVRHIQAAPDSDMTLLGIFDSHASPGELIEGIPVIGNVRNLVAHAGQLDIDEIIVAVPSGNHELLSTIMGELRSVPADITLCPDTIGLAMPILGVEEVNGLGLLRIYRRPISGWDRLMKAIEDRVLAIFLLTVFSPLFLLIGLAIKIDNPGSVFFRQRRSGFNNNSFVLYKFRTMRTGTEDETIVPQARRDDPRITRVGSFLRRTSLDELPQLLNVLRGEMSLVGPRPHAVAHNVHYAELIDQYLSRHRVKPGITGWAQVHGHRGETQTIEKMQARVECDLYYIDHWSIWFDLRILLMTPFVGFVHRNAY
jgi:putative colanic acid biosynthesis UDP-glucose lipid carrier transferase